MGLNLALFASGVFLASQAYRYIYAVRNAPGTVIRTAQIDISNDITVGEVANNAMVLQARVAANPAILQTCIATNLRVADQDVNGIYNTIHENCTRMLLDSPEYVPATSSDVSPVTRPALKILAHLPNAMHYNGSPLANARVHNFSTIQACQNLVTVCLHAFSIKACQEIVQSCATNTLTNFRAISPESAAITATQAIVTMCTTSNRLSGSYCTNAQNNLGNAAAGALAVTKVHDYVDMNHTVTLVAIVSMIAFAIFALGLGSVCLMRRGNHQAIDQATIPKITELPSDDAAQEITTLSNDDTAPEITALQSDDTAPEITALQSDETAPEITTLPSDGTIPIADLTVETESDDDGIIEVVLLQPTLPTVKTSPVHISLDTDEQVPTVTTIPEIVTPANDPKIVEEPKIEPQPTQTNNTSNGWKVIGNLIGSFFSALGRWFLSFFS